MKVMRSRGLYGQRLGDIFSLKTAPAFATRTLRKTDIAVTEIRCDAENNGLTKPIPREDALLVTLQLRDCPRYDLWLDDKPVTTGPLEAGVTCFYDLRRNPIANSISPFHSLQFYLPCHALNLLADMEGKRHVGNFNDNPGHAVKDQTIRGLGYSLLPAFARPTEACQLFIDHVTIAAAAYVLQTYGVGEVFPLNRSGGLLPRQEGLVKELLAANLDGNVSVSQLARLCGLPVTVFSRAFHQSVGMAPHQWLLNHRIDSAKDLLRRTKLSLAEIASICGFASKGHFMRVFIRAEGVSPDIWRDRGQEEHRSLPS
jgi:AraC family transcriptional regulator